MELNIRTHFETFLDKKITAIMDLTLSEIDVNPFLLSTIHHQLNLKTSQDLSKWMIMQRLERSMVTGFGSTLQNIAKEFSTDKPLPNLTAKIIRNGKTYNFVIKSGPNHNVQVVQNIRRILLHSKTIESDSIPVFGICYGNESIVGSIVKKYTKGIQVLIGKHFWDFISEDQNCYKKILEIASSVGKNYKDPDVGSLGEVISHKIEEFSSELKKIYGDTDVKLWSGMLEGKY